MVDMSVEQEIASLSTEVRLMSKRADENQPVLNETRDIARDIQAKMIGVEKGFSDGAAKFAKIEKDIENHDDRLTVLETWKAEHKGKGGLLNWLLGTLIAAGTLAVLAWTALKMH